MRKLIVGQQMRAIESCLGSRDAFHVPGVQVTTDQALTGGNSVRFTDNTFKRVELCDWDKKHAIIDPFIKGPLNGKMFWVFLVPHLVNSLIHSFELSIEFAEQTD